MITHENNQSKLLKGFREIFEMNIPLAKLINVNIETRSSDFDSINYNSTSHLIVASASANAMVTKNESSNMNSSANITLKSQEVYSTLPSSDKDDINTTASLQYRSTEQSLITYSNDISQSINIMTELPLTTYSQAQEVKRHSMDKSNFLQQKESLNDIPIFASTVSHDENFAILEESYVSAKSFLSPNTKSDKQGLEYYTATTDLDLFEINVATSLNYENTSKELPIYEDQIPISVEKDSTMVDTNFASNTILQTNDTDSSTKNISEYPNNAVQNFEEQQSVTKNYVINSAFVETTDKPIEKKVYQENTSIRPTFQSLSENDSNSSSIATTSIYLEENNRPTHVNPYLHNDVTADINEQINIKYSKPKLNLTKLQNFSLWSNIRTTPSLKSSIFIEENISSTIVISLASSFTFALIVFIIISLCLVRKRKYHNKVYLSYELAKPQSYITKPMRPSILVEETPSPEEENNIQDYFRKPKQPLILDQELGAYISSSSNLQMKHSHSVESCNSGIDNIGFVDSNDQEKLFISHIKLHGSESKKNYLPKYTLKKKKIIQDSKLRICSSDGSIYYSSPSLAKCIVPPPPYSPKLLHKCTTSQNKDSVLLTEDSHGNDSVHCLSETSDIFASPSTSVF